MVVEHLEREKLEEKKEIGKERDNKRRAEELRPLEVEVAGRDWSRGGRSQRRRKEARGGGATAPGRRG